eukprot:TRINITY_DN3113_c0_g1_i1.p1 TRINITY_DN3113_c0_g1~~TRINITY_DN3113_c0_g1_i1.p1  ORF type:complete len:803 (-),score=214.54 TRINITY_DN3113_c0_g1_i1:17-2425(-)
MLKSLPSISLRLTHSKHNRIQRRQQSKRHLNNQKTNVKVFTQSYFTRNFLWEKKAKSVTFEESDYNEVVDDYKSSEASQLADEGMRLYDEDMFHKALEKFDQCQKLKPDNNYLRFYRGLCHQNIGNLEKARDLLQQTVSEMPDFIEGMVNLGIIQHELGDADTALESWKKALDIQPDEKNPIWKENCSIAYRNMGVVYKERNEYDKAKSYFSKAYKIFPDPATLLNLGDVFADTLDFQKAEACYTEALNTSPTAEGYYAYGCMHVFNDWDKRDLNAGITYLNKSIELTDKTQILPESYYTLAWGHFLNNDLKQGVESASKGMKIDRDPESVSEMLSICGDTFLKHEMYKESLDYYLYALKINTNKKSDFKIKGNIGIILYHTGKKKEAISFLIDAFKDSQGTEYLRLICRYAVENQEYQKAANILDKWESLDNSAAEIVYLRAKVYYEIGKDRNEVHKMLEKLMKEIQSNEEKEKEMFFHGWAYDCIRLTWKCLFELGDIAGGIALMNQGIKLNPNDHKALKELARHLIEEKITLPIGIKYLKRIVHRFDFLANFELGKALILDGKHLQAINHFDRLLKNPKTPPEVVYKSYHFIISLCQILGDDTQYSIRQNMFEEYKKQHPGVVVEYTSVEGMISDYESKEAKYEGLATEIEEIDFDFEEMRNSDLDSQKYGMKVAQIDEILKNYSIPEQEPDIDPSRFMQSYDAGGIDMTNPTEEDIKKLEKIKAQIEEDQRKESIGYFDENDEVEEEIKEAFRQFESLSNQVNQAFHQEIEHQIGEDSENISDSPFTGAEDIMKKRKH